MKQVIVTTTINKPTSALLSFIRRKNYDVVVVGDRKTPHEDYTALEKKYSNFNKLDNKGLSIDNFEDYYSSLFSNSEAETSEQNVIKTKVKSHFINLKVKIFEEIFNEIDLKN